MSAFLTSLASVADQYGQAKESARQEKQQIAEKAQRMDVEQAYLQLARQAEARQRESEQARIAQGDIIKVGNRLWSVSKGKFIDPQQPDPMMHLREFIKTLPPDIQKGATARAQAIAEQDPNDPKGVITEVMRYADEAQRLAQAEANRREDTKTRHQEHEEDVKNQHEFQQQQRRELEAFQRNMVDWRLQEKAKQMNPQERQIYDSVRGMEPMINRTVTFLEQTKDASGKPLKDENDLVFGNRSALMQHLRFKGYQFGQSQEAATQQLIKNAAALQIMGAAPWRNIAGRSKYSYEVIIQHLPRPTDTPGQLYDKITWLRDNVIPDVKQSLAGYETPGGSGSVGGAGASDSDPLGVLK